MATKEWLKLTDQWDQIMDRPLIKNREKIIMPDGLKMKALSIKQPWSWLIVNGYKNVENRTWKHNLRGKFLIHASLGFDKVGYKWVKKNLPYIPLPREIEFMRGGIVGSAELVEISKEPLKTHNSEWHQKGFYGFYLQNMKTLPFKVVRGRLSFFEVDYE